eukprot:gene13314-19157_t
MIRWLRDMCTRSRSTFIGLMIGGVLSTIAALLAIAAFVSPELSDVTTLAVALATTMVSFTQVALSYREFVSRNPAPSGSTDVFRTDALFATKLSSLGQPLLLKRAMKM